MGKSTLKGKDLLTLEELSTSEVDEILATALRLKEERKKGVVKSDLIGGKSIALIFEKPSTRTRVSFDVAAYELGGNPIYMDVSETQLGRGEPIKDFARVLSRYVHCIVARVYKQSTLEEMARYSDKPVINALSDDFHPTQLLADLMTILELRGRLRGVKVAFVGDGSWNMANTWLYAAAKVGVDLTLACPDLLRPREEYLTKALKMAQETGARIEVISSPQEAVRDADVIYTDVWTSMGQEAQRESMLKALSSYTVRGELLPLAKQDVIFMHPLPAHRGEEVEEDVIEGRRSVVFDQAENKLHVAKALLYLMLSGM